MKKVQHKTIVLLKCIQGMLENQQAVTKAQILEMTDCKESTINSLINRGLLKDSGQKVQSVSSSGTGRSSMKKTYFLTVDAQDVLSEYEKTSSQESIPDTIAPDTSSEEDSGGSEESEE